MANPRCSCRLHTESGLTESEMSAAHQLMQLSDEDNKKIRKISSHEFDQDEEVDESLSDITSAKIEEIFRKDEFFRTKKKQRYRSLVDLYMETRSINTNGKKVRVLAAKTLPTDQDRKLVSSSRHSNY